MHSSIRSYFRLHGLTTSNLDVPIPSICICIGSLAVRTTSRPEEKTLNTLHHIETFAASRDWSNLPPFTETTDYCDCGRGK
jgi:hypothetical protein